MQTPAKVSATRPRGKDTCYLPRIFSTPVFAKVRACLFELGSSLSGSRRLWHKASMLRLSAMPSRDIPYRTYYIPSEAEVDAKVRASLKAFQDFKAGA